MSISPTQSKSTGKIVRRLILVTVLMFAFGFLLVPLYDVFCAITGLNGKTSGPVALTEVSYDEDRWINVQFIATNNENMPWEFYPHIEEMKVNPGAWNQVEFWAFNPTSEVMTGQAIPSVAPSKGADYFHKTECFCFEQQQLDSQQGIDMPLVFSIDKDLPADIKTLTLSYTLFDVQQFNNS